MLTLTAAESVRDSSCLILPALAAGIQRAIDHAAPENLPSAVCDALRQHARLDGLLDDQQCQGDPDRYTRHVLYSQPLGLFTVVGLVWRPGQITPVHGHYTWCSYIVLRGAMREEQFQWNRRTNCAEKSGEVSRVAGDCVASHAGLKEIHRLQNAGDEVAITLHVYGVDAQRVSSHVNRVLSLA